MSSEDVAANFRKAVESMQMDDAVELLADDVIFRSPAVFKAYAGKEMVGHILKAVATVFEDFQYDAEFAAPDGHVLLFSAHVGNRTLQGVDILRIVDDQIAEFTVMIRPLSGLNAVAARMGELLAGS